MHFGGFSYIKWICASSKHICLMSECRFPHHSIPKAPMLSKVNLYVLKYGSFCF
ncbi:hypothetical protein AB205_0217070 [Aquarana catesbeiana]|uniref:Uncharacterized protein n=1 Tax=Aquarana catesbeiana TaxID=8400 RepID=A0A2G9PCQ1_AQUCT|nr:hypothetical protein AB205_0217070 [Aquarana catesbeiana]